MLPFLFRLLLFFISKKILVNVHEWESFFRVDDVLTLGLLNKTCMPPFFPLLSLFTFFFTFLSCYLSSFSSSLSSLPLPFSSLPSSSPFFLLQVLLPHSYTAYRILLFSAFLICFSFFVVFLISIFSSVLFVYAGILSHFTP